MARSARKYDAVLPGLPKLKEEPTYQERIDRVKREVVDRTAMALALRYIELRERKRAIEDQLKDANLHIAAFEQLLEDSKEQRADGWGKYGVKDNALRLSSGEIIRVHSEPYGQIKDREAFRLWCLANGYDRQLQLWPSTMNAIVKERLLNGEPEPDGCEAYARTTVRYVRKGESEED